MEHIKPNCFIVGAQKCGTTSLYNYLQQHPDIYFPYVKEPRFFNYKYDNRKHNGPGDHVWDESRITNLEDYYDLYKKRVQETVIGDATIEYIYFPKVADDIKKFNPNAKIIIVLRNPIERAFSAYTHLRRDLRESLSFEEGLRQEEKRKSSNFHMIWHYKEVGKYYEQVKTYLETFGVEQVKVILFDDLKNNTKSVLDSLLSFLELSQYEFETSNQHNISGIPKNEQLQKIVKNNFLKKTLFKMLPQYLRESLKKRVTTRNLEKIEMDAKTRKYLIEYYKNDILKTERLINRDLIHWISMDKKSSITK